jgi:hypothetical protein
MQDKSPHEQQKERRRRRSQSPQTRRSKSPKKGNYSSRGDDARNTITQARVNRSHYEWDGGNYEDEETEMGALCFTLGFIEHKYPRDSSYLTTRKSTMDHMNPNYGFQIIFKLLKYPGLKGNSNAKLTATPHRCSTVLVKQATRRFHWKLERAGKAIHKQFPTTYTRPTSIEEVKSCVQRSGEALRSYI